jgi:hypothetical protein
MKFTVLMTLLISSVGVESFITSLYNSARVSTIVSPSSSPSFDVKSGSSKRHIMKYSTQQLRMTIVSPFDNADDTTADSSSTSTTTKTAGYNPLPTNDEPLELTWENVDMVLEEMRPYLLQDGGNVAISEIDGPVVRLELQVCSI